VYPMENAAIAVILIVAIAVMFWRLAARGPSRMSRALYTIAAILLCIWLLNVILQIVRTPGPS
jgi:hypothetical protein